MTQMYAHRMFCFAGICLVVAPNACYAQAPKALVLSGAYKGTHDPSIAKDGDTYYVFATGAAVAAPSSQSSSPSAPSGAMSSATLPQLPIRCSPDLHTWTRCGAVFPDGLPEWIRGASPATKELWAPDISFFDGVYHVYYAYSTFGGNASGIGLVTNSTLNTKSPRYKWVDQGLVLKSISQDDFNAIDPNLILDEQGKAWLAFGSFWSGIKMRELDRATGKVSAVHTHLYSLATREKPGDTPQARSGLPPDWEAVEAPFVLHHGAFYYLFVSWDLCCRGIHSTYHTMVGRSASVHGPYVDRTGRPMMQGGGSPFLTANGQWVGPGGESLLHLKDHDIVVFHAYDASNGFPALQISSVDWSNGWPSAALGTQ
jgi:arabinan endo-1,5-alpha-L-arabinosidase